MEWLDLTFDEALARADGRPIALKFDASWCSMCGDLDREVLRTQAVDAVLDGVLGVRVDFDLPSTRPLVERFAILDLPTVVICEPDGAERERVSSFRDAAGWLAEARHAMACEDAVGALERQIADDPDDVGARLALAERLLSRDPDAGQAQLEAIAWAERPEPAAAHALFLLGRYLHRVRQDTHAARFVWRELALRFGHLDYARGAYWWHALAQADRGRVDLGARGLEARVERCPGQAEPIVEWGRFVGRTRYEPDRERVRAAAMAALSRARRGEREQLEELVLQLGRGFEDGPLPRL